MAMTKIASVASVSNMGVVGEVLVTIAGKGIILSHFIQV